MRLSDDEVETALVALLRTEAALAAARAGLLVEAEARSLRTRTPALSTARWLTQRMRVSRARGERLVREADVVSSEPVLRDALAAGHCSTEQAVVVGKVLEELPPVEDHLRAERSYGPGSARPDRSRDSIVRAHWRGAVAQLVRAADS